MTPTPEVQQRLRRYLLGQLQDDRREEIEKDLLANDEVFEELLVVEDEVTDEYINGRLNDQERAAFEKHFLATPERREKLKFGRAFNRYSSSQAAATKNVRSLETAPAIWGRVQNLVSSPIGIAMLAVLVVGIAIGIWQIFPHQSEVDKSLVALNAAYKEQRPLESRISSLNYAPYPTTRGPGDEKVDQNELRRAELTLLEELNKNPTPTVRHALGKVFLAKKEFDKAIEQFNEALKSDPKNAQIHSDLGAAWLEKGKIDREGRDAAKSTEEFGRSLEQLDRALELDPNLLEARFNRALCRQNLLIGKQSEDDWQEYLKRDSSSPWADEARRNLKTLEDQRGKKTETRGQLLQDFLRAYELKNGDGMWAPLKVSRGRSGNLIVEELLDEYLKLSSKGPASEAEAHLRILSDIGKLESDRVNDHYTSDVVRFYSSTKPAERETLARARDLMRRANERYNLAEFDQASQLYVEAESSFSGIGDHAEALFAQSWIGYCRLRMSDQDKGAELFERLAGTFEERRYLSLASQSLQALADAESSLNEFSKTAELANRALKQAEQIEDGATAVHCLAQLLSTHLALGDYDRSLAYFHRAVSTAETLPRDPRLIWPIYYDAGLNFQFLSMPATAFALEREALSLANEANAALLRSRSWERLGVLYGEQGKYEEAIKNGELALAESHNISGGRTKNNMLAHSMLRLGQLNNQARQPAAALNYFNQALELYEKLDFQLYLYEAHKGRLIAYIQTGDDAAANSEIATVLNLFEQNREKITDETSRNKFFDAGQSTYDLAIDFAYQKKGAEAALGFAEESRARSLFEMMRTGAQVSHTNEELGIKLGANSKPLSPAQIRANLPAEVQLLEYSMLDDKLITWVITRSSFKSEARAIKAPDLENKIRNFVGGISQSSHSNRETITQQGKDLYEMLVAPVEKYLDRNLVLAIVPDKALNYLPFEALVSSASGRYLVEDFRMQRVPSATIFIESSGQASKLVNIAGERLFSVGNPKFDRAQYGSLPDLPAAAREANEVADLYQPETHLVGEAATVRRVKRNMTVANVIHMATHAVADERSPLLSKLLMAPDDQTSNDPTSSALTAAEIYQTKLPRTRLVVLSACRTGIENAYRGEGAIGLARPFMVAGVPLVIASLWPVESETTAALMISFHQHRKKDADQVSTVEALRRAQLEMIHNPPPNSATSFGWAAFVAIGGYATF